MEISAVAVDIDGTITNSKRELCISAIEALRACEANGIPVIIVTGNVVNFAYGASVLIGCSGGVVAENGGIIYKANQNNNEIQQIGDRTYIDLADQHIKNKINKEVELKNSSDDRFRITEIAYYKTISKEFIMDLIKDFKYLDKINIYDSGFAIHITNKNINKGSSLKILCENSGINIKNVLAIGDSENDEEFLSVAGFKVALLNSDDKLKEISDYICQNKYGDGVKEAIEKFVLR